MNSSKKSRIAKYEGLIELGQITSSSMDYKNIEKRAEAKIKKLLDCKYAYIFKYNSKSEKLEREFKENKKVEVISFSRDEYSFVGSCAHLGTIVKVENLATDIRMKKSASYYGKISVESILLVPLFSKGELVGVIEAINSNQRDFNDEDIHFAEAIANQVTMVLDNATLFDKLQKQFIQVVEAMADAIGKKDAYTGGHTRRVRHFSEMIGKEMDLSFHDMNNLKLSAVLHDIGKIGIEDKILKKEAALTEDEFKVMREHPRLGHEILGHIDSLSEVVDGMRFHHERPDGKGYPYGLKGDEIPVIAMIISVADTFDAMISTRPYRKGLPPMIAWQEILDNRGTQFSEKVVDAFDKAFRKTKMFRPDKLEKAG